MIVGIVLSVPATPAPPSEPGGVITASRTSSAASAGTLRRGGHQTGCRARQRVQRWTAGPAAVAVSVAGVTRHPGHRHGHIPPAHARDQPGSARRPVAGLKELNDLLDGPVGPARLPLPRPHREIPSWPRLALTLYATPATGSVICGMAKIWQKAWISSASRMSRNWPAAVLTMAGRPRWRRCRLWVSSRPVEVRLHGVEARTSRHSGISPFRGKTVWRVAMMARSTGSAGS